MILVIFVLAGAAGAAYYYIKFVKGRKPNDEDMDFFDDEGYEEEPYINEDEEPVSYTHLDVYKRQLPVHVRCLLDEFANIGQIPKFDKLIATIRSREISASIILQSQSQLKTKMCIRDRSCTV